MSEGKRSKLLIRVGVAGVFGVVLSLFLMFGPPGLLAKSEAPVFCGGCHVMESEYESWFHTGAHKRKKCVECHLPNENVAMHYVWKAIDGMKDVVFFYSGRVPEHITITAHGAEVLQGNCIRCHSEAVQNVNPGRKCWDCHRWITHKRSGSIETL